MRKISKKKKVKDEHAKNTIIEDTELLSKEQLKKVAKQPTNNIRVSGKRKRRMLKRLKHAEKTKNQMDVEPEATSSTVGKKGKKNNDVAMDKDSDDDVTMDDQEMA